MPGPDVVKAHAYRWLRVANQSVGLRLEAAVLAVEYQKNGWPHLHPLLRLAGGRQHPDVPVLDQLWFNEHGYAKLESPRDDAAVAAYATKYLVKDLAKGDVLFYPRSGPWPLHQPALEPAAAPGARAR